MLAHQQFKLETKSLHLDSSSFSLHGSYETEGSNESLVSDVLLTTLLVIR